MDFLDPLVEAVVVHSHWSLPGEQSIILGEDESAIQGEEDDSRLSSCCGVNLGLWLAVA